VDKKNQLLELLAKSQRNEVDFIAGLSDEEGAMSGTPQGWEVKDEVAHIAAWKAISSKRIRAYMANEDPPNYDDVDVLNDELFQHHKDDTWQEVQDFHERTYQELDEQVRLMEEDDLLDGQRYDWLRGRSLWKRTVHNGYFHPQGHIALYFSHHGEKERGNELMEEITKTMLPLDESDQWQGQSIYNLGCFYAQTGENEKAIKNLERAFSFDQDLIEWSKTDTDLDGIREAPGYQALVSGNLQQE
jgi:tetratricopeptide (TPR) repeat protein